MRIAVAILLTVCAARAQFKSTVPLVVAPTTIIDAKGHYVDGIDSEDLILYDNNVAQPVQVEFSDIPSRWSSRCRPAKTRSDSRQARRKRHSVFQRAGAYGGETAVISFSDEVTVHQNFTTDPDPVIRALRNLKVEGGDAVTLDALMQALQMLGTRSPERRRIIFLIAEKRDRSSESKLPEVVREVQRQNATVYWLTYSPLLTPFTARRKTENGKPAPATGDLNLIAVFTELAHLRQPDISNLLSRMTGAKTMSFLKKRELENEIAAIADEVHRQYILSFQPPRGRPGQFHTIRVEVKGRPDLKAKTREGYWAVN